MTLKHHLIALLLSGVSATSLAQSGSNLGHCQGLSGSAMAMCLQGVGPGSGRAAPETPRQESRVPANPGSASAAPKSGETGASTSSGSSRGYWSFDDWSFSEWSLGASSLSEWFGLGSDSGKCEGLAGAARALCMRGVGPAGTAPETPRREVRTPANGASTRTSVDAKASVTSSDSSSSGWRFGDLFDFERNSGKCQGLAGAAKAQCMQGVEPAPGGNANSRSTNSR